MVEGTRARTAEGGPGRRQRRPQPKLQSRRRNKGTDTPFTCVPGLVSISVTPGGGQDDGRTLRTRWVSYARREVASGNTGPFGMNRQL